MPLSETLLNQALHVQEPDLYDVVLLNDDFTTMDFVVELLRTVFFKNAEEAAAIMMEVHKRGEGVAGTYNYDIAASKVHKATDMAREEGFPLNLNLRKRI